MQLTLKVENLSVKLGEDSRTVLNSICAHIKPGQVLGKFHQHRVKQHLDWGQFGRVKIHLSDLIMAAET